MNLKWDLKELYENDQEFYDEIENIKILLADIKTYESEELNEVTLLEILNKEWKIKELANNVLIYGSLLYYKNVQSEESLARKKVAETFNNEVNLELSFIDRKILKYGKEKINELIAKNHELETYKLYLDNLFRIEEHVQDKDINKEIKSNIDNINSLLTLYNSILKDVKFGEIEIDEEMVEITSSNIAKYLS